MGSSNGLPKSSALSQAGLPSQAAPRPVLFQRVQLLVQRKARNQAGDAWRIGARHQGNVRVRHGLGEYFEESQPALQVAPAAPECSC